MNYLSVLSDIQANWHYLLMPLVAGFVGYVTKLLALEMMFRPVQFVGIFPPYLGWQGVVPRKAAKMASAATDLLLGRIFQLDELMRRLDPERMMKEFEGPLLRASESLMHEVGEQYISGFWTRVPEFAQRAMIRRMHREIPGFAQQIWEEVCRDPAYYIDIKHLLVSNLVKDKALLITILKGIGHKEFTFFRNAGFWFGAVLGLVQLACWLAWHEAWLIPVFGATVGLVSDWLALQMLFRPLYPTRFLGFTLQGKFIARKKEVARDYASLIAKQLLTPANLLEEILRGPCADRIVKLVHAHVKDASDKQLGLAQPLIIYALGSNRYDEIREYVIKRILEMIPVSSYQIEKYALDALDINNTIVSRMDLLTPEEFEGMLRPAFKEDEKVLILTGAVLGFLIGELQVQLML